MVWKILVEGIRKRRGEDLVKKERNKEGRMEGEVKPDDPKGYDSRVPVEIWDGMSWEYEGERVSEALNVL